MNVQKQDLAMQGDARLSAIFARTVEAMKEVVREFAITEDELHLAGRYFNRLGQSGMCPSLFDVALAMTAIEASGAASVGTRPNLEGPYHATHKVRADGDLLERPADEGATALTLSGMVRDAVTGAPLAGAVLDVWQADGGGTYDRGGDHLRGKVVTDAQGRYCIRTVLPNDYAEHDHDPIGELFRAMGKPNTRAAHIHIKASVQDRLLLTTQVFMPTSAFLDRDYVEGAVSEDLILKLEPHGDGYRAVFDIELAVA